MILWMRVTMHKRGPWRQLGGRDHQPRGAMQDAVPDISTSQGAFEVEARKIGVLEGGISGRCNRVRDHKRGLKVGVRESAVPNLHERGRLRQVEARELGVPEGL